MKEEVKPDARNESFYIELDKIDAKHREILKSPLREYCEVFDGDNRWRLIIKDEEEPLPKFVVDEIVAMFNELYLRPTHP